MEELIKRYNSTLKALDKFKKDVDFLTSENSVVSEYYEQFRGSAIQSFECSLDTLWKFIKEYLVYTEGMSFNSPTPRGVFRECWAINLINEMEFIQLSDLISDRNSTSHSYDELVAEEISNRLPEHYHLMKNILDRIDASNFEKI